MATVTLKKWKCMVGAPVFLPVDYHGQEDFMIDDEGQPVWPVRSEDDRSALTKIAGLFGAKLISVPARIGIARCRGDEVVALGGDVEYDARLYAHLTGRCVRVVERISDILPQPNLAVIVASLNTLSSTHLHHIYEGARIAPGLICATYGHSVRSQILVRSAAARLRAIDAGEPWIISVPNLRVGSEDILGWRIMGSQSEAQETTKAMSGGQGVLAISTHSDGIDAFLGPSLTLCPFKRAGISFDGANSPSCKTTGFCHRLKMPLADAIMSEQTISPDILSARVLIMDACYGLLLANSPVSPTYGLSSRFMHSATLGAIITTWELALLDVRKLQPILLDLGRGLSIGRAVGNFNRSSYARTWAHRFCILGDP